MQNSEVLDKAIECISDGRSLIESLDGSPAFVRNTEHAKQARRTAVAAIELIGELVGRVRIEMQLANAKGVENGSAK